MGPCSRLRPCFGHQHHCGGQPGQCRVPEHPACGHVRPCSRFGHQHHCGGQPGQCRVPEHPACGHVRPCSRFGHQHHCGGQPGFQPSCVVCHGRCRLARAFAQRLGQVLVGFSVVQSERVNLARVVQVPRV